MSIKKHHTWRDWFTSANSVVHKYWEFKLPQPSKQQKKDIEEKAKQIINAVIDDPKGRIKLQEEFYEKYGYGEKFGYGNSAVAFMEWEVERGVLNPVGKERGGSPWWRNVNSSFLLNNKIGELLFQAKLSGSSFSKPVQYWLAYLRLPTASSWYRAHNSSISQAYVDEVESAKQEFASEQVFMNEVLSRVLYAEEMVNGRAFPFGCLGKLLANSKLPSVDVMVHLPAFYPDHYPLNPDDIRNILHENKDIEDELVRILDDTFIHPHLKHMYAQAAKRLSNPELNKFVKNGKMIYPDISKD